MRGALSERRFQVRSGTGPQGTWQVAVGKPAPYLRGAVARYRGFRISTAVRPRSWVEIPVGMPCVIFGFGIPMTLEDATGAGSGPETFTSVVIGLRTRCLRASHDGLVFGVEAMFTPAGAYQLLGCAMHEITNAVFSAPAVLGVEAQILEERLMEAAGWGECFDLLDGFFAGRAMSAGEGSTEVRHGWSWLEAARPRAASGKLADELGWSQRRLELAFREQVGLTPGAVVRMSRFRCAVRLLVRGGLSLAELADRCGYYDQSHFNREFRSVTGTTPQRYLASLGGAEGPGGDIGLPNRMEVRGQRGESQRETTAA
jgi:AraC-like DNA-binding protein